MHKEAFFAVAYVNIDSLPPSRRRKLCLIDLNLIINQFSMIRDKFGEVQTQLHSQAELDLTSNWCVFLYEDFIYRKYVVRERVWDYLEVVLGIKRTASFLGDVKKALSKSYPDILAVFNRLQDALDSDIALRNVSIHKTVLLPTVATPQENEHEVSLTDEQLIKQAIEAFSGFIEMQFVQIDEFIDVCKAWVQICEERFEK